MKFKEKLVHGNLIRRYKRFLADIKLDNGEIVVAHCTNSGSMKSCIVEGAEVFLTPVNDPKRKTRFTWEMIKINESWVGIKTHNPNTLVYEEIKAGNLPGLEGYDFVQREVKFGESRFDVYAENSREKCFVEVKNVTYKNGNFALFPDAVTSRGLKHLLTLKKVKEEGLRAVMVYVIQRTDVTEFAPAKQIDPKYAQALKEVFNVGVEIIPLQVLVTPEEIKIHKIIPFQLSI